MWNALMARITVALMTEYPTLFALSGDSGNEHADKSKWDLEQFAENAKEKIAQWGGLIIILLGLLMMVVGAVKIGKGLMTHGQGQPTNWVINILLVVAGGCFAVFGFNLFRNFDTHQGFNSFESSLDCGLLCFLSLEQMSKSIKSRN